MKKIFNETVKPWTVGKCDIHEKSIHDVAFVIGYFKNGVISRSFRFAADLNRFGHTINFCNSFETEKLAHLKTLHQHLMELIVTDNVPFEYLCTVILNYICGFEKVSDVYYELPNQDLGIIVKIDIDDFMGIDVDGGTREEFDKFIEMVYNLKFNVN